VVAGRSFTATLASFQPNVLTATPANFGATIDWSDGVTTPGVIVQGANQEGLSTFYVQGTDTPAAAGALNYTVTVSGGDGNATTSDTGTIMVAAPALAAASAPIGGIQGEPLNSPVVVATFTTSEFIADPASFAAGTVATINWGDGSASSPGTVQFMGSSPAGTTFYVTGDHTYQIITDVFEVYQVSVTIETPDGAGAVVADLAQLEVPVLTGPPPAIATQQGSVLNAPLAVIHAAS